MQRVRCPGVVTRFHRSRLVDRECGYALQGQLCAERIECQVVAPLIPRKPGDRIKTDRRDASKLAELFEGGLLTEVHAPTPEAEAVRDLCRAREYAMEDRMRARHRLSKFLLRRGLVYRGRAWRKAHHEWLRDLAITAAGCPARRLRSGTPTRGRWRLRTENP